MMRIADTYDRCRSCGQPITHTEPSTLCSDCLSACTAAVLGVYGQGGTDSDRELIEVAAEGKNNRATA